MFALFDWIAIPLGWLLRLIYQLVHNYFVAIILFTLLIRLVSFPFYLKSQKSSAERARLAPRLERLQKKYANNRQLLQQKQQELYEKEGVSMMGGCLPTLVPMLVLFGVIAAIYQPLTHMTGIPSDVINASITSITEVENGDNTYRIPQKEATSGSYYRELRLMNLMDKGDNRQLIISAIDAVDAEKRKDVTGADYYDQFLEMRGQFYIGGLNFLENPWNGGFAGINWLWLVPLISGLTALASSLLSMHFNKGSMSPEQQQAAGCTNGMMYFMPLFSVYISFIVPGAVGIYWICSNLIALVQTYVLNKMYNPAVIRAQAEIEYQEKRARRAAEKAAEKKRLAESRQKEAEQEKTEAETPAPSAGKKKSAKAKTKPAAGDDAEAKADADTETATSDMPEETDQKSEG